ncbi:MAG TPA: ferritin family protein [Desulfobacteraceae bacterium]|nr:ferritin family protein [Desulfobacteraceae bacterium]
MSEDKTLGVLKKAIILEQRGHAFYRNVADQAENSEVKAFFASMADEEIHHLNVLSAQFKAYNRKGTFDPETFQEEDSSQLSRAILTPGVLKKISAAGYESSAITAAIAMEQNAVRVYGEQAEKTDDHEEKRVYQWLSSWEGEHLNMLLEVDRALMEQVWSDNSFWPF